MPVFAVFFCCKFHRDSCYLQTVQLLCLFSLCFFAVNFIATLVICKQSSYYACFRCVLETKSRTSICRGSRFIANSPATMPVFAVFFCCKFHRDSCYLQTVQLLCLFSLCFRDKIKDLNLPGILIYCKQSSYYACFRCVFLL
jgi:hypothetical protein